MIIWKGIGIAVAFFAALFIFLSKYILPEGIDFKYNMGVGMIMAGLFWWLSMWKKEKQEAKIMAGDNEKQKEALRKRNEIPGMADLSQSSLFFISVIYWHYILIGGGIAFLLSTLF